MPRLPAWARSATTSGAVFTPFPSGCGQKSHAGCCADLPGITPAASTRLPHGFFDPQRILRNACEQTLRQGSDHLDVGDAGFLERFPLRLEAEFQIEGFGTALGMQQDRTVAALRRRLQQ